MSEYKKNPNEEEEKGSFFDKIIDPNDKDRGLKIFAIYFAGAIILLALISLIFGNGGFADNFGGIVNTYKDY